jgi:hypothetical protein
LLGRQPICSCLRLIFRKITCNILARQQTAVSVRFNRIPIARPLSPVSANFRNLSSSVCFHVVRTASHVPSLKTPSFFWYTDHSPAASPPQGNRFAGFSFPLRLRFTSQPRGPQPFTIIVEGRCTGGLIGQGRSGGGPFRGFKVFIAQLALKCSKGRGHSFSFSPG